MEVMGGAAAAVLRRPARACMMSAREGIPEVVAGARGARSAGAMGLTSIWRRLACFCLTASASSSRKVRPENALPAR